MINSACSTLEGARFREVLQTYSDEVFYLIAKVRYNNEPHITFHKGIIIQVFSAVLNLNYSTVCTLEYLQKPISQISVRYFLGKVICSGCFFSPSEIKKKKKKKSIPSTSRQLNPVKTCKKPYSS